MPTQNQESHRTQKHFRILWLRKKFNPPVFSSLKLFCFLTDVHIHIRNGNFRNYWTDHNDSCWGNRRSLCKLGCRNNNRSCKDNKRNHSSDFRGGNGRKLVHTSTTRSPEPTEKGTTIFKNEIKIAFRNAFSESSTKNFSENCELTKIIILTMIVSISTDEIAKRLRIWCLAKK